MPNQGQDPVWQQQQNERHARWLVLRRKHTQEQADLRQQAAHSQMTFNNRVTTASAAMLARQQHEEAEFWSNDFNLNRNVGNANAGANAQRPDAPPPYAAVQGQVGGQPVVHPRLPDVAPNPPTMHPRLPDVPPRAPTAASNTPASASRVPVAPSRLPQLVKAVSTPTRTRSEQNRPTPNTPVIDLTEDDSTESSIPKSRAPASSTRKSHARTSAGRVRPLIWPSKSNFLDLSADDSNTSWTKKPPAFVKVGDKLPDLGIWVPVERSDSPSFTRYHTGVVERSGDSHTIGSTQGTVSGHGFTKKREDMVVKVEHERPVMIIEDPVPHGFTAVKPAPRAQGTGTGASSAKPSSFTNDTAPRYEPPNYASYEDYLAGNTAVQPSHIPNETGFKCPSQHGRVSGDNHNQHVSDATNSTASASTLSSASKKRKEASDGSNLPLMFKKMKPGNNDSATRDAQKTFTRVAMSKAPFSHTHSGSRGGYVMIDDEDDDEEVSSPSTSHRRSAAPFGPGTRVASSVSAYANHHKGKQSAKKSIQHLPSEEEALRSEQAAFDAERHDHRVRGRVNHTHHRNNYSNGQASNERDMSHRMHSMSITPGPYPPTPSAQPPAGFTFWSDTRATGDRHITKYLPPFVESEDDDDELHVPPQPEIKLELEQQYTRAHRGIKTGGQSYTRGGKRK